MNVRARARLDFWIEAVGLLLFVGIVAAWFIISSTSPLTHQVKLRSTAAELGLDERSGVVYRIISALPSSWKK